MFPILFEFGELTVHTFGVLVAAAFLAGIWFFRREAVRNGEDPRFAFDFGFWLLVVGVIGARLLFVAVHWRGYQTWFQDMRASLGLGRALPMWLVEIFSVWQGGLVWYGGFLLSLLFGFVFLKLRKRPVWKTADMAAPAVMLGLGIGRLGCFAAGDDYGKVVESAWQKVQAGEKAPWWTVAFTDSESLVPDDLLGVPLIPVQLIMSLYAFFLFAFLLWLHRRKTYEGQVLGSMLLSYATGRFFIEFLRGDAARGFLFDGLLSTSQFISLILIPLSIWLLLRLRKRSLGVDGSSPGSRLGILL